MAQPNFSAEKHDISGEKNDRSQKAESFDSPKPGGSPKFAGDAGKKSLNLILNLKLSMHSLSMLDKSPPQSESTGLLSVNAPNQEPKAKGSAKKSNKARPIVGGSKKSQSHKVGSASIQSQPGGPGVLPGMVDVYKKHSRKPSNASHSHFGSMGSIRTSRQSNRGSGKASTRSRTSKATASNSVRSPSFKMDMKGGFFSRLKAAVVEDFSM